MKSLITIILYFLIYIPGFSQSNFINTAKLYSDTVLIQLRNTILYWPTYIKNYRLVSIEIVKNTDELTDSSKVKYYLTAITDTSNRCSFYSVNSKNLTLNFIRDVFYDGNRFNAQKYEQLASYVKGKMAVNDRVMEVRLGLCEHEQGNIFYIPDIIIYNNRGMRYDNILHFINPMRNMPFNKSKHL